MGTKLDSLFSNFAQLVEAENLEPAGVGKNAALPRHKPVQPAHLAEGFMSGSQIEVIRIAEKNLDAKLFQNVLRHAFDGTQRSDGHEHWSLDFAAWGSDAAEASRAITSFY